MKEKLIAIQLREGLKDREMAKRLSVARSTWTDIRNGKLALSPGSRLKAVEAFPELLGELVRSVSESARDEVA